jgi:hypothetical protein
MPDPPVEPLGDRLPACHQNLIYRPGSEITLISCGLPMVSAIMSSPFSSSSKREQYVVGAVHTQTIEGFWSIIKRGIVGSFHKVSRKYMPLYVAEFQFRYNNRLNADIFWNGA